MTAQDSTPADEPLALTVGQRLLWMYGHYRGDTALHVPMFFEFVGDLDADVLQRAFNVVVARHEALRTTYVTRSRRPAREVHDSLFVTLERVSLGDGGLDEVLREHVVRPLDLSAGPVRAVLVHTGDDVAVLCLVIHHLSTDGWSGGVVSRDLQRAYRDIVEDSVASTASPASPAWQLSDFAEWQQRHLAGEGLPADQRYWRSHLQDAVGPTWADADPEAKGYGTIPFDLPYNEFSGLVRAHRTSAFTVGFALFAATLRRVTTGGDVAVSTMFANRGRPELEETVGFLANLAVLRLVAPAGATFADFASLSREVIMDALDHQETPYHLVPRSDGERAADLESVMFQIAAGPAYELTVPGCEVRQLDPPLGLPSRFDVEFDLIPEPGRMRGILWHRRLRLSDDAAQRLVAAYTALCREAHADAGVVV